MSSLEKMKLLESMIKRFVEDNRDKSLSNQILCNQASKLMVYVQALIESLNEANSKITSINQTIKDKAEQLESYYQDVLKDDVPSLKEDMSKIKDFVNNLEGVLKEYDPVQISELATKIKEASLKLANG